MLNRLETYVRHETPTGHPAQLNALGEVLLDRHRGLGARVRRVPHETGDHLVMDHPGTGSKTTAAPVLFIGHHDTVWPLGQLEAVMPWRVDDGVASGPGAYDMKGGLVVLETALELVADVEHPPVRVVIVADEEVGSPTSTALITQCADGVAAALGFEAPHPDGRFKVGRRGSTRLRLTIHGIEAHAAADPDKGVSAVDELVDQLIELRSIVTATPDEVLCNVGTVWGGSRTNVVPALASADIGLRFTSAHSERTILNQIRALTPIRTGAVVHVETMSQRPTWMPNQGPSNLLEALVAAGGRLGQRVDSRPAAGAADTNTTGSMGIATVDGLGPRGAGAHAIHEQVIVSSLPERATLVGTILTLL